jgi:hypothetical protein
MELANSDTKAFPDVVASLCRLPEACYDIMADTFSSACSRICRPLNTLLSALQRKCDTSIGYRYI